MPTRIIQIFFLKFFISRQSNLEQFKKLKNFLSLVLCVRMAATDAATGEVATGEATGAATGVTATGAAGAVGGVATGAVATGAVGRVATGAVGAAVTGAVGAVTRPG